MMNHHTRYNRRTHTYHSIGDTLIIVSFSVPAPFVERSFTISLPMTKKEGKKYLTTTVLRALKPKRCSAVERLKYYSGI
jgi:hypothetical protein